ncbi:Small nuclear ribonucleoprotein family protein [Hibiscus syriacus]|uniref:Small nuclear ribonucleoprotein family protein n=1 Tax=Hibiscus syriacus TaxID=106335 RepID=A0A6A3CJ29_HIBSY|nr:Small nuclear ribonucleoprotein family protein [Hibiscus syriacus]
MASGFEASQVNYKGEKPMGFALFSTAQLAVAAKDALQDMNFDAESKSVLHTEMAKKNLFVKEDFGMCCLGGVEQCIRIVADSNSYDQSKRLRTGGDYSHSAYTTPSPFHPPAPVWGPHGYLAPTPPYDPYGGYPVPPVPMPTSAPSPAPSIMCLFSQPGFKQMKILRQERHTVCFRDVNSASNVHHSLQGAVIPSSGSVGMRIQYSKNPFGRRKDSNHSVASPSANGTPPALTYQ